MLAIAPKRFANFQGESISIEYNCDPEEDQTPEELLLPVPTWAQEPQLSKHMDNQLLGLLGVTVEELFGSETVYCGIGIKRKRKGRR